MRFEDYNIRTELKRGIAKMGLVKPTDIQFKAIPNILNGEDVLAIAQTRRGKTAAFAIPLISMLSRKIRRERGDGVRAIVMAPTHELALQITEVINKIARYTSVSCLCLHGGVEQDPQIEQLQKGVEILVCTPGRLFDLNHQGFINLKRCEILILDEADHMLDRGFKKDIEDLIRFLPQKRQTLFFSATINPEIKNLAYSLVSNPIRIQISPKDPISKNVDHAVCYIEMDDKRFFLERFYKEHKDKKILTFVRTKVRAERVVKAMERAEIKSVSLHGDKDQKSRTEALNSFKTGAINLLIATDVSARGIDIEGVDFVINYDLPDQAENYVHRIGRTGRGRARGQAISFCSEHERELLKLIEEYIYQPVRELSLEKAEYLETIDLAVGNSKRLDDLLGEIENLEEFRRKKKKSRK
ncbi:MAG: DEAD/DEAH box helicase [Saprospiraceae bacterium]|nr:DEAD/DEAH box helicase [Saprospiraceae bacterium]